MDFEIFEEYWEDEELSDHGLTIHLGHGGQPCSLPQRTKILTILHTNGFHHVSIRFCGCSANADERLEYRQLLSVMLFPASMDSPSTVFTFALLDSLDTLSERGKTSIYDYYETLRILTDSCGFKVFGVSSLYD